MMRTEEESEVHRHPRIPFKNIRERGEKSQNKNFQNSGNHQGLGVNLGVIFKSRFRTF